MTETIQGLESSNVGVVGVVGAGAVRDAAWEAVGQPRRERWSGGGIRLRAADERRALGVGVDIVHGHSSHHAKAIEIYRDRLILYGCGDFINDYEGIGGHERFRPDLALMYFPTVSPAGELVELRLVSKQMKQFRLNRAGRDDAAWLRDVLNRESKRFDSRFELIGDAVLRAVLSGA